MTVELWIVLTYLIATLETEKLIRKMMNRFEKIEKKLIMYTAFETLSANSVAL